MTDIVLHGHFYQPPRENPWTGMIDREAGAQPWANWNERIYFECYRPNAHARILDAQGRIERIVNNYRYLSFNVGPTLLQWMQAAHPNTYRILVEADRESARARGGHGNAIAQSFHHAILPLCNERDRRTQIRWGVADFEHRFGRTPEAMWLPETACDDTTLGALIDEGLRYVLLAPEQAERTRPLTGGSWVDAAGGAGVDPRRAYRYFHRDRSGRSIAVFFFDGEVSRSIAFHGLLATSQGLVDRLLAASRGGPLVLAATDGETFGHHVPFGDRTLAHALEVEAPARGLRVTNLGEHLERHPPAWEVEIRKGPHGEGTSWSCAHGVSRWIRDCGCRTGGDPGWNQAWRGPLRAALDLLRDRAAALFEEAGAPLFGDPWAARDAYGRIRLDPARNPSRAFGRPLDDAETVRALTLLESQRESMQMYTSCGWFFADLAGLETVLVLRHAARLIDHLRDLGMDAHEDRFLEVLSQARSNDPARGNGADVYRRLVEPSRVTPWRVVAHLAITGLAGDAEPMGHVASYDFERGKERREVRDGATVTTGRVTLESTQTRRRIDAAFAAAHLGGVDFACRVRAWPGDDEFERIAAGLGPRDLAEQFGGDPYGLDHVLAPGREWILEAAYGELIGRLSGQLVAVYEQNQRLIRTLQLVGFELPPELRAAAEFTLGKRFEEEIERQQGSRDPAAYRRAAEIAREVAERGYRIDRTKANRLFEEMITSAAAAAVDTRDADVIASCLQLLSLAKRMGLRVHLDRAQEIVYRGLGRNGGGEAIRELAEALQIAPSQSSGRR